ncbi:MAG: CDP-archaeol synthase [Xenococcaceae cyanobacterium]
MNELQILHIFIRDILNIVWLSCGLFIAGVMEAFFWKTSLFEYFNRPIQSELFGANKRWRGLISLPLTNTISSCLLQFLEINLLPVSNDMILFSRFNCLEYGLLVGFVFNLSELPNSFVKRRLKIPPGDESNRVFYFVDHMDSTYGVLILWWLYFQFPFHLIVTGFVVAPLLFMGATWLRKKLGLK